MRKSRKDSNSRRRRFAIPAGWSIDPRVMIDRYDVYSRATHRWYGIYLQLICEHGVVSVIRYPTTEPSDVMMWRSDFKIWSTFGRLGDQKGARHVWLQVDQNGGCRRGGSFSFWMWDVWTRRFISLRTPLLSCAARLVMSSCHHWVGVEFSFMLYIYYMQYARQGKFWKSNNQ